MNVGIADFVSSRLCNYQYHPVWGFLASQAWLRRSGVWAAVAGAFLASVELEAVRCCRGLVAGLALPRSARPAGSGAPRRALGWAFALGIPLGVLSALRSGTVVDRATTALAGVTIGLPSFFIGTALLWLLAVKVGVVPTSGWDGWRAKLLPSFVLSLVPLSMIARALRGEMLEVIGSEHVCTFVPDL